MKLLLLTPFIFLSISVNAQSKTTEIGKVTQSSTVIAEKGRLFDDEIRKQNIEILIAQKEKELDQTASKYNLNNSVYDWQEYATFNSKEKLNEHIAKYDKIAYDIFRNSNIFSICNEIDNLKSQIGGSKSNSCKRYTSNLAMARKNVESAKRRIDHLNGIVKKEKHKENTHQAEMDLLDKELQEFKNNSNGLSSELNDINNKNTSKSLGDFLASNNNKTSNDFLSEPGSNNDDFLSESSDGSSDDFLSERNHNSDFKITSKNGLQGVVNAKGEVLIPFKDWQIVEYKMGIAKVSIQVTEKLFPIYKSSDKYYCRINKVGFVDKTGNYINGYTLTSKIGFSGSPSGLWLSPVNDDRSIEQIKRDRERIRKIQGNRKQQAQNEAKQWALNYIR